MRTWLALLGAVCALLALPGATHGGSYIPPPGDGLPVWSPDGNTIAFLTSRGGLGLAVVSADGSAERRILDAYGSPSPYPDPTGVALSPDWQWVAATRVMDNVLVLVVVRLDGSEERPLALTAYGAKPAWSPDSRRIAFRMFDGTLAAQGIDGADFVRLAPGGTTLAWSPDGTRLAYAGGTADSVDIHVVGADGRNDAVVAGGWGSQFEPTWSPDGTMIAFLTEQLRVPFALAVVRADGSNRRTYQGPDVTSARAFAWTPDGRAIVYARAGTQGLFRLELATGEQRRLTTFGSTPAFSPDGTRIAFAGGGGCRDRYGIYVAHADGNRAARLTNDCRIVGTARGDVIRGTGLADVLVGLGGDDRLLAWPREPGYTGDTLLGGDGNDLLIGAYQADALRGGRGGDRLRGGKSADVLEGGRGRDRIDGQGGPDFVYARDGSRDIVTCGTNLGSSTPERDEVWADRVDVVSPDCEIVHRPH